jgi:hypothetical protein
MTKEKKPLFELSAPELEEELSAMFEPFRASHPIRCEVGAALMAAEVATQRICLREIAPLAGASGGTNDPSRNAQGNVFDDFEALNAYLVEGKPSRIDLVLWDAAGFIHGWFLDQRGRPDVQRESCPEVSLVRRSAHGWPGCRACAAWCRPSTPELATGRRGCPRSKSNRHAGL